MKCHSIYGLLYLLKHASASLCNTMPALLILLYALLLMRRLTMRYASLHYFSFLFLHPSLALRVSFMTIDSPGTSPVIVYKSSHLRSTLHHYNTSCPIAIPYIYFTVHVCGLMGASY